MGPVLGPGLSVGRYGAGVVVRHHYDESRTEHHQEGQQIARHLDFTTRPRTGRTSVSRPAAGAISTLSFMAISPFAPRQIYPGRLRPQAEMTTTSRTIHPSAGVEGRGNATPGSGDVRP